MKVAIHLLYLIAFSGGKKIRFYYGLGYGQVEVVLDLVTEVAKLNHAFCPNSYHVTYRLHFSFFSITFLGTVFIQDCGKLQKVGWGIMKSRETTTTWLMQQFWGPECGGCIWWLCVSG